MCRNTISTFFVALLKGFPIIYWLDVLLLGKNIFSSGLLTAIYQKIHRDCYFIEAQLIKKIEQKKFKKTIFHQKRKKISRSTLKNKKNQKKTKNLKNNNQIKKTNNKRKKIINKNKNKIKNKMNKQKIKNKNRNKK